MEMTKDILSKLQEVIDANLPQQMGASFKTFFEQSEKDRNDLKFSKMKVESLEKELIDANKVITEYSKKENKYNELNAREAELNKKQAEQEKFEMTLKLLEAEKRSDMMHNFVSQITRNTTFRETMFKNDNVCVEYHNNQQIPVNRGGSMTSEKTMD